MPEKKRPAAPKPVTQPKAPAAEKKSIPRPVKAPKPEPAPGPVAPRRKAAAKRPVAAKKPVSRQATSRQPRVANRDTLSILMVAPEAHPFAKTGGLAEVAGALPLALARLGHSVTLVLPRYGIISADGERLDSTLAFGTRTEPVSFIRRPLAERITAVLVDAPALFDRPGLYGEDGVDYADNGWRFAVLSLAALEYARLTGERPSIIHAHDWQTGLVPVFQKMRYSDDPIVGGVPVVFTIHNLAFQGVFSASTLPVLGLGWEMLNLQAMEYWGQISYLKGGINFSERITTVSPTYAREILTPDLGFGFDGILRRRADALSGILNGIDVERWNPEADTYVPARFSASDLAGKAAAKRALLEAVRLPATEEMLRRPLIGLISRLTDQKGYDLIAEARSDMMALDAAWVMLGSGERRYEEDWLARAAQAPGRVSTTIGFDERLAHLIEAGADMFLMPSRFEPCGLNQMYSHRYGTVPIVRATGGLQDTVKDVEEGPGATGFKFRDYSAAALVGVLRRALDAFRNQTAWNGIQREGMRQDHSWDASARDYVKVYEAAAGRRSQ